MSRKKKSTGAGWVDYNGKKYQVIFNLNVMEEIQEAYGAVEKWGLLVEAEAEPKAKDVKFGFMAMLNEGIDIWNEEHANDDGFVARPFFTDKQVGRLISDIGLKESALILNTQVVESTKSDEKN